MLEPPKPNPPQNRPPTSHERMTGKPWDASYQNGPAPWDIGQPQSAVVRLVSQSTFTAPVLDAGCGTGEHTLLIASRGVPVLGIDVAETAIATARQKAADRGIPAEFATADALHLDRLGRKFKTVLDCGLFHTFDAQERPQYAASLATAIEPAGTLYILCFSDQGPEPVPHPIREEEIRAAFPSNMGWKILAIEPDRLQTRFHGNNGAPAWLATINRR